jgi:hypothetical protein
MASVIIYQDSRIYQQPIISRSMSQAFEDAPNFHAWRRNTLGVKASCDGAQRRSAVRL